MDGRDDSVCLVDSDFLFDWTTTTALLAFFRAHEHGWASLGWVGGWVGGCAAIRGSGRCHP
jgi:hypothetical protein